MDRIQKQVSVVFRIMDAITGKPVNRNLVAIYANGQKVDSIQKEDGYFVIINLPWERANFEIRSRLYQWESFHYNREELDKTNPVIPIYLNPGVEYPGVAGMTALSGKIKYSGKAPEEILVVYTSYWEKIKIAQETVVKGSHQIRLYTSGNRELPGRMFIIRDKDERHDELCRVIKGPNTNGYYSLEMGLAHEHKRGDLLKNVLRSAVDESGNFHVTLQDIDHQDLEVNLYLRRGNSVSLLKKCNIECDRINQIGEI